MATRTVKVRVMTWNAGDEKPPEDLKPFLGLDRADDLPDILAVGLQEIVDDDSWFKLIMDLCKARGYTRVKTRTMNAVTTQVFVQRKHQHQVTNVESEVTKTGFGGVAGNKGGVSVRLDFYGVNLIFVNAHFQAHIENYVDRIEDFNDIIKTQHFRDDSVDVILDHDYVFWTGDLNFRIADLVKVEIEQRIKDGNLSSLWRHEQLHKGMEEQLLFQEFEEGELNFAPTFKFDKGTDNYDTSDKERKPAWTDRILWKTHKNHAFKGVELGCDLLKYSSIPEYKHSDHKPVFAEFNMKVLENGIPMAVYFYRVEDVKKHEKVRFTYKLDAKIELSKRDWIGLYPADFMTYDNYCAYVMAKDCKIGENVVMEIDQKKAEGSFILAYFNKNKNCLIGYSNEFKIVRKSAKSKCHVL